jgi:CBS domain-containing protein
LVSVAPDTPITEACRLMEENKVGCLVVENSGKLCGILTDRDIALRVSGARKEPDKTPVKDVMTPDPIRISADRETHHLTSLMRAYNVRRIPIVDGFDRTIGIVTMDDLIVRFGSEMSAIGCAVAEEFPQASGSRSPAA